MSQNDPTQDFKEKSQLPFSTSPYVDAFQKYRQIDPSIIAKWQAAFAELLEDIDKDEVNILDLGCGTGRFTMPLATLNCGKKLTVYALDKASAMVARLIDHVKAAHLTNINAQAGDFQEWEAPVLFDFIFISEVLQLIPDLNLFFAKVYRSLYQNGIVAIRTPSHNQLSQIEWLHQFPNLLKIDMERTLDIEPLTKLLEAQGLHFHMAQEIDESTLVPTDVYIDFLAQKPHSILHLLDEEVFQSSLKTLETSLASQSMVKRNMLITLLSVRKQGGVF